MTKTHWLVIVGSISFALEVQDTDELVGLARDHYLIARGGAPVEPKHFERYFLDALMEGEEEPENVRFIRVPGDFVSTWDHVTWDFEDFLEGLIPIQLMEDERDRPDR